MDEMEPVDLEDENSIEFKSSSDSFENDFEDIKSISLCDLKQISKIHISDPIDKTKD